LHEPDPAAVATPPLYMVFDLLYRDGRDLTARALHDRRARLEEVVAGSELVFPVRRRASDGHEAWAQVVECGDEGCVAKRTRPARTRQVDEAVADVKQKGGTVDDDRCQRRILEVDSE
jgi:ATP-dependent DNA ligase